LVTAWEQSGLTQAEFCRRQGVKAESFAWWKRKLVGTKARIPKSARGHVRDNERTERATFVEVGLSGRRSAPGFEGALPAPGYEVVLPGGALIRVPIDFDPDQVSRLVRVVTSSC
jgi:hypothetical protein